MRQEQQLKVDQSMAMRVWTYISTPFQITKVLELLYMLDWIWYAILSYLPSKYISGTFFDVLRLNFAALTITILISIIAVLHVYALLHNIVWLRKTVLLFNIGVLIYLTVTIVLRTYPNISAGIGYYVILIGVSIFAFWRMDESR